jgi:hypothetical protein
VDLSFWVHYSVSLTSALPWRIAFGTQQRPPRSYVTEFEAAHGHAHYGQSIEWSKRPRRHPLAQRRSCSSSLPMTQAVVNGFVCAWIDTLGAGCFFFGDCHDDFGFGRRRTYVNKHAAKASASGGNPSAPCAPKHSYASASWRVAVGCRLIKSPSDR